MKRFQRTAIWAGSAAAVFGVVFTAAAAARAAKSEQPDWAYAIPVGPDQPAARDDGTVFSLPGAAASFTLNQIRGRRDNASTVRVPPADWYPNDHPPMPKIVAEGDNARGIIACALCHYPNGKGRSENAPVAGLPKEYIAEQLHDMRAGLRTTAEPRKANAFVMITIAKGMTEDEIAASAAYFSAMPWTPWMRVVEAAKVPKTYSAAGLNLPLTGKDAGNEPIGDRIVEVPENPEHTDTLRDPHSGFIVYAPPGAVAKGRDIVRTGAGGRTLQCAICHGRNLGGVGWIPGISGRSPSYIARQLYDFRQGARHGAMGALMQPVVARLTADDMVDIAAYLASVPPPDAAK